jgi:hypothetical protein
MCEALYNKASSCVDGAHIFPLFDMTPVLISFSICFSIGLLLSAMLIYRNVKPRRSNSMNGMNKNLESLWERVLAAFFGTCQAILSIVGMVAIVFALCSEGELYWVGMAVQCNLQTLSGTNVQVFQSIFRVY